jgi:hypothetical protein
MSAIAVITSDRMEIGRPSLISINLLMQACMTVHILAQISVVLPALDGTMLRPPQRTASPEMFAPPVPYNPRYSLDWGHVREADQQDREAAEAANARRLADEARERQLESGAPVWWEGEKR